MNRRLLSVAALLLSASFGMGCLAEDGSDGDFEQVELSVEVDGASDTDLDAGGQVSDEGMSISEYVARTKLAKNHDTFEATDTSGHDPLVAVTGNDQEMPPEGATSDDGLASGSLEVFGPEPQPWKLVREEEKLGPEPQPW